MEEVKIVNEILDFISTIDFSTTKEANSQISVFETNIRYLGGLISGRILTTLSLDKEWAIPMLTVIGYDLLKGPWSKLVSDETKVDKLLSQAVVLADSLSIAFDTPSGITDTTVFLNPVPKRSGASTNGPAGIGTMVLEWTRLSDLTGNNTYAALVQKSQDYLVHPKGVPEPYPGLVGETLSLETGEFTDAAGGWGAGTDSFYEYLIKMYLYDPEQFSAYKDRWVLAADSTMEHLASHPTSREDLTFLMQFDGTELTPYSGHCELTHPLPGVYHLAC